MPHQKPYPKHSYHFFLQFLKLLSGAYTKINANRKIAQIIGATTINFQSCCVPSKNIENILLPHL